MISVNYLSTFLLIAFSGYFLNVVNFSPIYAAFLLGLAGIIFYCIKIRKIAICRVQEFAILFILYIFVTQTLLMQNKNHAEINVLFSLIYLVIVIIGLSSLGEDEVLKIAKSFIYISLPLLIVEALYRISNPIVYYNNEITAGRAYYKYKYNSIMFEDSNYVGVFIITLFFLCTYLEHRNKRINLKLPKIILMILTVATFSKAAIATLAIFFVLFELNIPKFFKTVLILLAAVFGLQDFIAQILIDGSLSGKLGLFKYTAQYLSSAPLYRVLFGVGFGNTKNVITQGIGAHNLLTTYIVEAGVVGLIMLLVLWLLILIDSNGKAIIVMAPVFLDGMSLIGHAIPFVYCAFAIIYVLESDFSQNRPEFMPNRSL